MRVHVEVFADAALKRRVQKTEVVTNEARGHSVHVHLQQLQPSTDYWYRFTQGDASSTVGHTRTAPALNADVRELRRYLDLPFELSEGDGALRAWLADHADAIALPRRWRFR